MSNSFSTRSSLQVGDRSYEIHRLTTLGDKVERLPYSLKVLLENLLRFEDGKTVTRADIEALLDWDPQAEPSREIAYRPARVLMQDFTGVPAVVDLAAMRDAMQALGGDPGEDQPVATGGTGHRSFGADRQLSATAAPSTSMPKSNTSATRNATAFSNGVRKLSRTLRWCRPTPASCTR